MHFEPNFPLPRARASVSVVIPVYNAEATLLRAVESLVHQSVIPCEVLLVDDCSIDASLVVCEQAREKFSVWFAIRILPLASNRGPSHARNRGWDLASGKYIAFLDADDSWHCEKVKIQWDFMEKNPEVSLCGHLCGIHQATVDTTSPVRTKILHPWRMLLSNPFSTPTVMLRRSLRHRFSEKLRFSEDYHLWLQMALDGLILARMEHELAVLHKERYGAGGLSGDMSGMARGEIAAYRSLYRERRISGILLWFLIPYSFGKFLRRQVALLAKKSNLITVFP